MDLIRDEYLKVTDLDIIFREIEFQSNRQTNELLAKFVLIEEDERELILKLQS